jgi:hypothetical protein
MNQTTNTDGSKKAVLGSHTTIDGHVRGAWRQHMGTTAPSVSVPSRCCGSIQLRLVEQADALWCTISAPPASLSFEKVPQDSEVDQIPTAFCAFTLG